MSNHPSYTITSGRAFPAASRRAVLPRLACGLVAAVMVAVSCTAESVPHDVSRSGRGVSSTSLYPQTKAMAIAALGPSVRVSSAPKVLSLETVGMYVTTTVGTVGSESLHFQNVRFGYNASAGVFLGDADWPEKSLPCHVYASNAPMLFHAGGTTVWADGRQDVVCAYAGSPVWGSAVGMEFSHVFARLRNMTLQAEEGWTVTDISVSLEAGTSGTYDIRGGDGHADGTGWSDVLTEDVTGITGGVTGVTQFQCFVVPGTYLVRVSWTASIAGGADQSWSGMVAPLTLAAGEETDVTLSLGGAMYLSTSVAAWDDTVTVSEES